jgi:hypothetical protein
MTIDDVITNRKFIDLCFNQHKNIREVCKIVGKSSRYVVPVIKEQRIQLADNKEYEKPKVLPEVRGYKLFAEGKSPVEVAAKLNLPGSQVQQYYTKYWELNNMHELNAIYNEIKDNIGYFVTLFRFAKKERLTPEEVIGLINMSNDIQDLKRQYKRLNVSIVNLESILYESKEELKKLENQSSAATERIRSKSELIERKSEILSELISQRQKLEQYMDYIKNNQDFKEIEQIAANKVAELLSDNKKLVDFALVSAVAALRSDSDGRFLFNTLQSSFFPSFSILDDKSFWESKRAAGAEQFVKQRVLEDANRMLEWLKKGIVDTTIATVAGLDKESSNQQALPYYNSS